MVNLKVKNKNKNKIINSSKIKLKLNHFIQLTMPMHDQL